jgi:hypothetical protein
VSDRLAEIITEAGVLARDTGMPEFAAAAEELLERLKTGRVHLAVLGQFKRGKSTLLNALLGEPVLPSSVVPLTALPTLLKPGPGRRMEVAFADGRAPEVVEAETPHELATHLARFVTEAANPANVLNVAHVDVYHPAPLLASGVVLIDTPGIGSTLRHNTEATLNFLPQCDAAIFVVSPDPPITEVEVDFLGHVLDLVPRLFFVFNKVDYLSDAERVEALGFLETVLGERLGRVPEVICVSARQGLEARVEGSAAKWIASGCHRLAEALDRFAEEELRAVVRDATSARLGGLLDEIGSHLELERRLATMPLAELDRRAELFRQAVEEAARQRQAAQDLLAGDRRRTFERLEAEAAEARTRTRSALAEALARRGPDESVEAVLEREVPPLFERELGRATGIVESIAEQVLREHQRRADDLVRSVKEAASEVFGVELAAPEASEAFEMRREPYWVQHAWQLSLHLAPPAPLESALPHALRERKRKAREQAAIEQVVTNNIENLRWALLQNLNDMFLIFGARLDRMLAEATEAIERALIDARERAVQQQESVGERETQILGWQERLGQLRAALARDGAPGTYAVPLAGEPSGDPTREPV